MRVFILFCCLGLGAVPSAMAAPFYRETFTRCSSNQIVSTNANDIAGWKAFKSDSSVGKVGFLKVNTPGSYNHPFAYNSSPKGTEEGGAFWTKNVIGLTLFTDEFFFDISKLSLVHYEQRLSGFDKVRKLVDGTQLAFLIDGTWYISDQTVRQENRGAWEPVAFSPRQLTYGTVSGSKGKGPRRPGNFGIKLPSQGMVTAFGLFLSRVNGRVRIDNFTLSDSSLLPQAAPEEGTVEQCVVSQSDPGSNFGENVNSSQIGEFCSAITIKKAGKFQASSWVRTKLLNSIKGRTIESVRDRALFALLLNNNMRVDGLVNVRVRDYFTVGNLRLLNSSSRRQGTVPIKASVAKYIHDYLRQAKLGDKSLLPIFQHTDRTKKLLTNSALCTSDIIKILQARLREAGLSKRGKILG